MGQFPDLKFPVSSGRLGNAEKMLGFVGNC